MKPQTIRMVTIIICLIILASGGWNAITLSSTGEGYTTGYQGAKARYSGLQWKTKSKEGIISGTTRFPLKGTTFHFDADEKEYPTKYACNLEGEMTAVFLPEGPRPAGWVPADWWDIATGYIQNPTHHYEWEIRDEAKNETKLYAMEEYKLKWYFSISADWNGWHEYDDRRYMDTKVWFEFDLSPIWYFKGADTCHFCIAELRVSDIALGGKLGDKRKEAEPSDNCRVSPMSKASIIPIYYEPFGLQADRAERTVNEFQGVELNPALFRDKVYSYFTLVNFGTELTHYPLWVNKWKGDVVTVGFDFHVFVVGEWKVKDIQKPPDDYGRTAMKGSSGGIGEWFLDLLGSPQFGFWLGLGLIALFLLLLAIFAPSILFAIFGIARSFTGKAKKKGGG